MTPNPNVPGWAGDIYPFFDEIAAKIPLHGTYLEIGTFLGASLVHMGTLRPDLRLIAVDPWLDEPKDGWAGLGIYEDVVKQHGGLWFAFLETMRQHAPDVLRRTRIIRGTAETVRLIEPVDMVFIDGAHDEANVWRDIACYAPLATGGVIAGHDYHPDFPGVCRAVDRFVRECGPGWNLRTRETCWWLER